MIVPARVAAWLDERVDFRRLRVGARGDDAEVDAVLIALRTVALAHVTSGSGSSNFRKRDAEPEVVAPSDVMTTTAAADVLGMTDRGVRLACVEGRIPAHQVSGRWLMYRYDVESFATKRQESHV